MFLCVFFYVKGVVVPVMGETKDISKEGTIMASRPPYMYPLKKETPSYL